MDEEQIITNAYYLLEQDSDVWATTDEEYETARGFLNIGVGRWEHYENTTWRELWTTLQNDHTGADISTSAATYDYDCPEEMARPGGYVLTYSSTSSKTFWTVIPPEKVALYSNSDTYYCYFTGNRESGFDLHFNPRVTQSGGHSIDYPFYKKATTTSAASDVVEMGDPYFLSYFIAAHMSEGGINIDFMDMAETRLDNMRTENMSGYFGVPDNIEDNGDGFQGFGT